MTDRLSAPPNEVIDLARRKSGLSRTVEPPRAIAPYTSAVGIALGQLKKSRLARTGALVLAVLTLVAVFADLAASDLPLACKIHGQLHVLPNVSHPAALARYDNQRVSRELGADDWALYPPVRFGPLQRTDEILRPPLSPGHPLGTDAHGRDVLARLAHGARTSLTVGLMAVVAFVGIGIVLGALAGFFRGLLDSVVERIVETLTAFPTLVLVLVVQALMPHPSMTTMLLAIGLTRWTEVARLVRAEVLLVSAQDYVTAARALGASPLRILTKHVLPNAVAPALVAATFGVASVILIEAALDFLRVGLPDTVASWGEMLGEARQHVMAWWLLAFPGAMVFATVAALNVVGEALRDALDPRLRDAPHRATEAPRARDAKAPPTTEAFDESMHA